MDCNKMIILNLYEQQLNIIAKALKDFKKNVTADFIILTMRM